MESRVAVLGDADFVMPFSALGLDTFVAGHETAEILENARKIVDVGYALVVVAENVASIAERIFADQQNLPVPAIVVVPFTTEPTGVATKALGDVLKMATGINILENS